MKSITLELSHSALAFAPHSWHTYTHAWHSLRAEFVRRGFTVTEEESKTERKLIIKVYRADAQPDDPRSTTTVCSDFDTYEGWKQRGRAVMRREGARSGRPYFDTSLKTFHLSQTRELQQ